MIILKRLVLVFSISSVSETLMTTCIDNSEDFLRIKLLSQSVLSQVKRHLNVNAMSSKTYTVTSCSYDTLC